VLARRTEIAPRRRGRAAAGALRAVCLGAALATVGLGATVAPAGAAVESPFLTRYASSGFGDVTMAANTLMTCPDAGGTEANCIGARAGGPAPSLNNNGYAMELVDADADATTFDSSQATLSLPAGATVQFAGLYYGARTSKGEGGTAAPKAAARGVVLFQPPGAPGYSTLAAEVHDSSAIAAAYTGFVDVTAAVAAAGSGTYSVANVEAGTGVDRYAGWSLVVAYSDPASPPRSIRIYDGLASIQQNDPPLQIQATGLETPPTESVNANVGVVAYEGDRGSSGDRLSLAGQSLFDAANPVNNVFNSSISQAGVNVAAKAPNYVNQLGFDSDLINADGILANNATAATLEESTTQEQYLTQAVTVSIELNPAALLPPAPVPIPAPVVPPPPAEAKQPPPKQHQAGEPARLDLDLAAVSEARPTEVLSLDAEVSATGAAARDIRVCDTLPASLTLVAARGAKADGNQACWHLAKLAKGKSRSFRASVRVDATGARSLAAKTAVSAANAKTRRAVARVRVVPLPNTACGSSVLLRC
jgi:hypothetical protein